MAKLEVSLHTFHSPKFRGVVMEALAFFNDTPVHPLPPPTPFVGAGVYALYYIGSFPLYQRLRDGGGGIVQRPIYVGKAVLPGWRKARTENVAARSLSQRLREHTRSIVQTNNLQSADFRCRFIILNEAEGDLVVPIEAALIRKYKPLWNSAVDGFGNHDPGSGRHPQSKSEWDALHPGRPWAKKLTGRPPNPRDVTKRVRRYVEQRE